MVETGGFTSLVKDYNVALSDYTQWWHHVDDALRSVIEAHPGWSVREVYVRVVFVDTMYQAGLPRSLGSAPHADAASAMCAAQSRLEPLFDQVRTLTTLSSDAISPIVQAHAALCDVLASARPRGKAPRSFSAKYLHFLNDLVPIYDSQAALHMDQRYFGWRRFAATHQQLAELDRRVGGDGEYRRYAIRFLGLYERLVKVVPGAKVKILDHLLWL